MTMLLLAYLLGDRDYGLYLWLLSTTIDWPLVVRSPIMGSISCPLARARVLGLRNTRDYNIIQHVVKGSVREVTEDDRVGSEFFIFTGADVELINISMVNSVDPVGFRIICQQHGGVVGIAH